MSSILVYEPFYNFDRFSEHIFGPLINNSEVTQLERDNAIAECVFRPRMDLRGDSEKNLVSATFELPGVSKEDVQLELRDGQLSISVETKSSSEHEESGYAICERQFGKSSRSLRLPGGVNDEDIKAAIADGILTITFPETSPEQEARRISIAKVF